MGSLYRSEEMRFCQMIVEKDAAFACVAELGKKPLVEFKDLNIEVNSFQRMFVRDIRRFDEMERKLRFLENQIKKDSIEIVDNTWREECNAMGHHEINQLEQTLTDLERDVIHMNESDHQLKKNYLELKEWEAVLEKADGFFEGGINDAAIQEIEQAHETEAGFALKSEKEPIGYVVGVIAHEKVNAFERILWRACRRTAFLRYSEIDQDLEDPDTGEKVKESVFIVFYNGDRLRSIIDKVSEGFKAKQFNQCPKTSPERHAAATQVRSNINDMRTVMSQTKEHRLKVLNAAAVNLRSWMKQARLHKSIYHTLNLFTFDGIGKFFVAECWVPLREIDNVRIALETGVGKNGGTVKPVLNILHTDEAPPTYNRTNKFTAVFQGIVDSYGIASYLEVNPAPYTIITFPFIFSCMFGDFGHGILMLLCGLYLVLREKNLESRQIRDEIFNMFFGGRYIILLMGVFSLHAGLVYNDAYSISFNIFGSSWRNPYTMQTLNGLLNTSEATGKQVMLEMPPEFAYQHDMGPYPFGVDPIWNMAENKLNFLNSMKMKLSVIVGIAQMTFGVCLSLNNYRFFNSMIEIYTVFIPQLLFMGCIFIYLCFQIIVKWMTFWVQADTIFGRIYPGSHCAPSLLIGLINMFMFKDRQQWYPGQSFIEACLVLVAICCIPVMLFGKPLYILMQQRKAKQAVSENMSVRINMQTDETEVIRNGNGTNKADGDGEHHGGHGSHHDEAFGDIMVHQSIHTIEYVLGCVSHTASYLRLWALSLAHAQLSEVLWQMVLENSFAVDGIPGAIATYVIFFIFGVLTFSILVLMEGLSAFLHALRLHWVEFQSKFYLGLGYSFAPFSFHDVLEKARAADSIS
ncbi:v-type ATPase subunit family domain-containing protein [Ditylenchus destructor]|nr:v-type ATPase subunit family domain-containing protein [Ditylenchus destructor]